MVHGHAHHVHHRPLEARDPAKDNDFVVVYKTLDPDFEGEVGGYMTQNPDKPEPDTATKENKNVGVGPPVQATKTEENPQKTTEEASATEEKTTEAAMTTEEAHTTEKEAKETSETEKTTAEAPKTTENESVPTTTTEAQTSLSASSFVTSVTPTTAESSNELNQLAATSNPTTTDSAASASSTSFGGQSADISSGAKAGIAIGVIFGVGLIAALVFFFVRRKKRDQATEELEDEKFFGAQNLPPPPPISKSARISTPPQLKVRPITQFAPDLGNSGGINPTAGSAAVASRNLTGESPPTTPPKSAGSNPFNDPANPFSIAAEPAAEQSSVSASGAGPVGSSGMAAAGVAATGAVGATVAASHGSEKNQPSDPASADSDVRPPGQSSPSPASVDGDSISSSAMAAAGMAGAVGSGPTNVYRVQMDFNPSMDDELALRTGSLVRMLHEYDDGWALCVRLDRSQQGVVPRSCLSHRPVKPRARPPPGGIPGPRGPPRIGPNGRPISPAGRVPSGPGAGRFYPQDGRPRFPGGPGYARPPYPGGAMSPVQFPAVPGVGRPTVRQVPRSMSPAPYGGPGMQHPGTGAGQRQFSNSTGNASPHIPSAPSPKPPSPPIAAEPQAPSSDPPTIASSVPSSPPGPQANSKPAPGQDI